MYDFIMVILLIISVLFGPKLYSAAERGKMDEVDAAITKGADVQWKNANGK